MTSEPLPQQIWIAVKKQDLVWLPWEVCHEKGYVIAHCQIEHEARTIASLLTEAGIGNPDGEQLTRNIFKEQ